MLITQLSCGDIIRRGLSHDVFIGMGKSFHPYSTSAVAVWQLEDGQISVEEVDWTTDVGYLTSFRNNNESVLEKIFNNG